MARKHHAPETVLGRVIRALEREAETGSGAGGAAAEHRKAILTLLSEGPLFASETLLRELQQRLTREDVLVVRTELLTFLRAIVQGRGGEIFGGMPVTLAGPVDFQASQVDEQYVACAANGSTRDVAVLQMLMLLHSVGLENVFKCKAHDCPHLFVKTYRREFCSTQCQKRVFEREKRMENRRRREKQRRQRRRSEEG